MDRAAYAAEAKIEASHWWFVGRRRLFARLITQAGIPANAAVVDIGTGTGANLRLLRDMGFTHVTGIDPSAEAAHWCAEKGLGMVREGDIRALPLPDGSVDLVLATDVAEHVEDDHKALSEISRVLRPGGLALITVPAFPSLWGLQDERSHHYRRYRMAPFLRLLDRAGLHVEKKFHFNYLLFTPIYLARRLIKLFGIQLNSENEVNGPLLNRALGLIFRLDVSTAPYLNPPFGVSILALARRPGGMDQTESRTTP
ncbi:class I SAM-dependent methyltransferase [Mesorhizobium sp. BAC0120]|uniref:class I SAM-dependent methyltransferase n=1 Tax=Mesorhizobium sp. BAC0120 TaxID=3090670 RepID=UPI00298C4F4A|nr:class I SAM-dependent methyltransferase [Mesorhizobium sp. BAC0120]MDW6020955.1 class I SAM-dependent methyltransferase [Mesorhizobium sp. BAC0120]